MSLNKWCGIGRMVKDPNLRQTQSGKSVVSFTIAVERDFKNKDGEREADFINIVAWRQTADFICRYFKKGSMIAVEGEINTRRYEDKNGNKRIAFEVVAQHVYFAGAKVQAESKPELPDLSQFENLDLSYEEIDDPDLPF